MRRSKRQEGGLNLPMLIITAILSAVAWPVIYGVYALLRYRYVHPVTVGAAFTLLFAVVGLGVLIFSSMQGTYRSDVITGRSSVARLPLYLVLGCVLFFGAAALFQLIYQLDFLPKAAVLQGDYIFVIDDSGSMTSNDPNDQRYEVLSQLLQDQPGDTQYMIYGFADETQLLQPMKTVDEGLPTGLGGRSSGGTGIKRALEKVINDYDSGVWQAVHSPVVILLTDGHATDVWRNAELNDVLQRYEDADIAVSAIGMGSVDRSMLRNIAERTGGQFVNISDVTGLDGAYRVAAGIDGRRELLSHRDGAWAYGILRVLFVTALGTLLSLIAAICYGNTMTFGLIVRIGAVKAAVAALLLELLLEAVHLPALPVTWLMAVLIGTVVAQYGWAADRDVFEIGQEERQRKSKHLNTTAAFDEDFW